MRRPALATIAAACGFVTFCNAGALALEELKDEKDRLKGCEIKLCKVIAKKQPSSGTLACPLTKTWPRERLREGSASGKVNWSYGDARCSVDLAIDNSTIASAVAGAPATVQLAPHRIDCVIEREGEDVTMNFTVAPKLKLKDGKVEKIWINLQKANGPRSMTALAYSVAKLEDRIGIFHRHLVKAANHMILEKCPTVAAETK